MAAMTAKKALEAYGFKEVAGVFLRYIGPNEQAIDFSTERWAPVEGGFLCYKSDPSWGRPLEQLPGVYQVPFTQSEAYAGVSGLHPAKNPDAFEWVWPEEKVAFIYQYAGEGWRKVDNGDGKVEMVREKG